MLKYFRFSLSISYYAATPGRRPQTTLWRLMRFKIRTLHGRAVLVEPMISTLKVPGYMLLKLRYDGPLSLFAFKSNLCRYTTECHQRCFEVA